MPRRKCQHRLCLFGMFPFGDPCGKPVTNRGGGGALFCRKHQDELFRLIKRKGGWSVRNEKDAMDILRGRILKNA